MKDMIKDMFFSNFVSGILFMILGLILIFKPALTIMAVVYYLGITKLISGSIGVFKHTRQSEDSGNFDLALSIIDIIFGAGLIISPFFSMILTTVVPVIIGIWATVKGVMQAVNAFKYKGILKRWWVFLVLGIITASFGVFIMLNPVEIARDIVVFIGLMYLLSGIFIVYNFIKEYLYNKKNVV